MKWEKNRCKMNALIKICVSAINGFIFVNEMKNSLTAMNAVINLLDEMYSEWKDYYHNILTEKEM